ncbi:MAG: hypothetical protein ACJAZ2_001855, partial [Glaciecola sp.]
MTFKKIFILSVVLCSTFLANSQEQQTCVTNSRDPWEWPGHNNQFTSPTTVGWTGYGYIKNFKTGAVTRIGGGDAWTPELTISAYEGVTAASDDNGNLLFVSNGYYVWDNNGIRTYDKIKEGNEGVNKNGSASQGVLTVRHPLKPFDYYVFSVDDAQMPAIYGLNYSVIGPDAQPKSGPTRIGGFPTAEGITATMHANGVDVWVIVIEDGSSNIHAYLLTCNGIDLANSRISPVARSVTGQDLRGGIAMSWDGKMLATTFPNVGGAAARDEKLITYDFNNKTGVFSGRKNRDPGHAVDNSGYDIIFSPDNKKIISTTQSSKVFEFDIASETFTEHSHAGVVHSTIEIGGDGLYYFASDAGGVQTSSDLINYTDVAYGGGKMRSSKSLSNMYIPPAEEPDIIEAGPFCDTVPVWDLHTAWICSNGGVQDWDSLGGKVSAEDTLFLRNSYFLLDSNDVKSGSATPGIDPNSSSIVDEKTGKFYPKIAKKGTHRIVFVYCDVNDTIDIVVTECGGCQDTLKNVLPNLCVGDAPLLLDTMITAASADGIWTIDSFPGYNAVLTEGDTDTLFDASALSTKEGLHKLMFTVTDGSEICKDSIYIKVNKLPIATVDSNTICFGDPAVTLTATVDSLIGTVYTWSELA